jgi:AraC-like DNA-binding protein
MPESARVCVSDPLSDVLSTLNLRASIFVRTEAAAPFAISFPEGDARFHVVERGDIITTVSGIKKAIHAVAGDLLVFPRGEGHTIADKVGRRAIALDTVVKQRWDADARTLRVGGGGAPDTRLICGAYKLDRPGRDGLLSVLPPVLHVQGRNGRTSGHVDLLLQIFLTEANGTSAGSALCAARLVDLIFVHAIRDWLAKEPANVGGWLGAMRDRHVGSALSKLHDAPAHPWTVEELSERVGLSRSPLAARFTALVGEPPLRYLTRWRMHLASQLLRQGASVRETAQRVGYESEAAFSRTFKRYMGSAPVKFRTRSQTEAASEST